MTNQGRFAALLLSLAIAAPIIAQAQQPVAQGWSGWAQCQITIQAPGYSHRETHLWTVTGAGTRNANMEIYPTSWTVIGDGSLQRVNGPTTVSAQWAVNGTLPNVAIGTTLHLDRITVQRWTNHGPARSALTGSEISTTNGVARPRNVILDVQQWAFPSIETGTTSTRATGSNSLPFDGLRGPMNPPSGAMGTAACTWDFARGGVSPSAPPSSSVASPTTSSSGAPVSGGVPSGGGATGTGGSPGGAPGGTATGGNSAGGNSPGGAASPTTTDLAISFFGGSDPSGLTVPSSWPANGTARYGLGVVNLGSGPADGARITVPASGGLTKTAVSCGGQQGAQSTNPTVAQIENGFAITTLPPGSFVTCQILATVSATAGSSVTMAVSVTPPGGVRDPNPGNDAASQTLPIVPAPSSTTAPTGGPRIISVTPTTIEQGGSWVRIRLTGEGTHWQSSSQLALGPSITADNGDMFSAPTTLSTNLFVRWDAAPGPRAVTVTTGSEVVTLPNAVTVVQRQPPTVRIEPASARAGETVTLRFIGTGTLWKQDSSQPGPGGRTFAYFSGGSIRSVATPSDSRIYPTVTSPTEMTAVVVIDPATAPGTLDAVIANSSPLDMVESIEMAAAFTVLPPAATASTGGAGAASGGGATLPIVSSPPSGGAPSSGGGAGAGGAIAGSGAGSGGLNFRALATSGGFVVPAGVTTIGIELWGAGGGGAAGASGGFGAFSGPIGGAGGGGGGSGAYLRTTLTVTPGGSYNVVIGAGGNAGGGNGGNSEFTQGGTVLASAPGGAGGTGPAGGAGGVSMPGASVIARNGLNGSNAGALPPQAGNCSSGPPCQVSQGGAPGGGGGGPISGSVAPVGTTGGAGGNGGSTSSFFITTSQSQTSRGTAGAGTPGAPGYAIITW